ncbi:lipopolysaccharide biosynthesis protein [Microbacterium sp. NPDC057650]|uniref:lipopolysaccharide biosynthesis protein n=1 Tax=unclassified Microbacterium TaxID=2609290 RepID=UPI00366FE4A1
MRSPSNYLILSSVIRYISQFSLTFIFAHLFGVDAVGEYALALAVVSPFYVLAGWGLRNLVLTFSKDVSLRTYEFVRNLLTTVAFILVAAAAAFFVREHFLVVVLVAIMKVPDAYADFASGYLQRAAEYSRIAVIAVANAAMTVVPAFVIGFYSRDLVVTLLVTAAVLITTTAIMIPWALRLAVSAEARSVPVDGTDIRLVLRAGFPLAFAAAASMLLQTVPQYTLAVSDGAAEVGLFAVVMYLTFFSEIVLNGHAQAWIPTARRLRAEGREQLTVGAAVRAGRATALVVALISGAAIVGAYFLYPVFLGPFFSIQPGFVLPLLVIACCQPSLFFISTALSVHNNYGRQLTGSAIALAVAILSGLILIPQLATTGALWAYAIGVLVRTGISAWQLRASSRVSARP